MVTTEVRLFTGVVELGILPIEVTSLGSTWIVMNLVHDDVGKRVVTSGVVGHRHICVVVQRSFIVTPCDDAAAVVRSGFCVVVVCSRIRAARNVGTRAVILIGQRPIVRESIVGATQAHHIRGIAWLQLPVPISISRWRRYTVRATRLNKSCTKGVVGAVIDPGTATAIVQ